MEHVEENVGDKDLRVCESLLSGGEVDSAAKDLEVGCFGESGRRGPPPQKKKLQGFPPNLNKLARGATRNIAKAGEGELGVGVGDGGR
jgi:hypothetical protein